LGLPTNQRREDLIAGVILGPMTQSPHGLVKKVAGRRGETGLTAFVRLPFTKPTKPAIAYDEIWLRKTRRGGDWLRSFFALANLCQ